VEGDASVNPQPVFTPSAMPAADLDARTVGGTQLLDTLVNRIRSAARDGSRPHTLLIAPRGGGKTHTLHVAIHRALSAGETAEHVLPVILPEDSLAIGSYTDLLVEIARAVNPELATTAGELRRARDPVGIEAAVTDVAADRMILLAIENLDRVFDAIGTAGQGSLRAWIETSAAVLILGTAPQLFPGVSSRDYPWYGSFDVEALPELTVDDSATLLSRAAQRRADDDLVSFLASPAGHERLSVIHRLVGGLPRVWQLLSENVDAQALDALAPAVEALLDRLAPHYQQRLWQLPAGEQRLVVELARSGRPVTVSELAEAVGISNQSASAALGRLAAEHWVVSAKASTGDRRTSWYDLTEPLLRHHLRYRDNGGLTENDIRAAIREESQP
jgi:DNA-binding MarR family transcriptional regulator